VEEMSAFEGSNAYKSRLDGRAVYFIWCMAARDDKRLRQPHSLYASGIVEDHEALIFRPARR